MTTRTCSLIVFNNNFWGIGEVYIDGCLKAKINKFYEVTSDWIYIFDSNGGTGTGYTKGDLLEKVFIGDCEFKKVFK